VKFNKSYPFWESDQTDIDIIYPHHHHLHQSHLKQTWAAAVAEYSPQRSSTIFKINFTNKNFNFFLILFFSLQKVPCRLECGHVSCYLCLKERLANGNSEANSSTQATTVCYYCSICETLSTSCVRVTHSWYVYVNNKLCHFFSHILFECLVFISRST